MSLLVSESVKSASLLYNNSIAFDHRRYSGSKFVCFDGRKNGNARLTFQKTNRNTLHPVNIDPLVSVFFFDFLDWSLYHLKTFFYLR